MARLMVLYRTPKDAAAFDKYYFETHVPIAQKLPGLKKYEVSQGAVGSPAGDSGVHRVAILHFEDMAAIQVAVADVGVFAPEPGDAHDVSSVLFEHAACCRSWFAGERTPTSCMPHVGITMTVVVTGVDRESRRVHGRDRLRVGDPGGGAEVCP